MQDVHAMPLQQDGGVARWITTDSSPQGGWDWQMQGSVTLPLSIAVQDFRAANRLSCRQHNTRPDSQEQDDYMFLCRSLSLVAGVPVVVVSGYMCVYRCVLLALLL